MHHLECNLFIVLAPILFDSRSDRVEFLGIVCNLFLSADVLLKALVRQVPQGNVD